MAGGYPEHDGRRVDVIGFLALGGLYSLPTLPATY
jgi:hypothetical protein